MIKSMTGFGHSEYVSEDSKFTVEMKAVNHRYCDISIKMPRKLNCFEQTIRSFLKKQISRGKVDVFISYEDLSEKGSVVRLNRELGRAYYDALTTLAEDLGIRNETGVYQIGRMPEVMSLEDAAIDEIHLEKEVMEAVSGALAKFTESRRLEGESLKEDIFSKLTAMEENVTVVESRYPSMVADYRNRLEEKVRALLEDTTIDENRIAAEVVIYADKISVDEETVRLRSHISSMRDVLTQGGNVGRKLDFIAQEMNREANTILSKANDQSVSDYAIELKTDIEKIREQVQNIE